VDASLFYSQFLVAMRRFTEAEKEMKKALELDPFSAFSQGLWGVELLHMRRYDEAIPQIRKSLRMEPDVPMTLHALWIALHQMGEDEESAATASHFYSVLGEQEVADAIAHGYEEAGYSAAMRAGADTLVARSHSASVPPGRVALLYAQAEEKELALDWLEIAFEERSPDMTLLQVWHWDAVSDDPRFQELLRRMDFPKVPA
jgi:tetratricopeptide (TPR) repeat protein